MWIVTQDIEKIINTDKVEDIHIRECRKNCYLYYCVAANETILGKYETKEEALNQLAAIVSALEIGKQVYSME